ncbi:tetratricopeptide repeat protein [Thalassoglobus neptunius]|uniref:Tetratricopeptide repeat protein n=1 Tax=Thalassoglobus neptunius TaxID=1938619 RepID=A0A5C5X5X2_9PLAN|nr:tetratricopeptide repeat protein [Thalassoglobus neptunius]TWT57731.1 tetratricopeptide repeat protein [Thalassoglobus neptunius]
MKRVNTRFLLLSFATLLVCGIAVVSVHAFQIDRQANGYLREARKLTENVEIPDYEAASELSDEERQQLIKTLGESLGYYQRYLGINGSDAEAIEEGSLVLEGLGNLGLGFDFFRRSYLNMGKVLRLDPSRVEMRRKRTKLALQLGQFAAGRADLQAVEQAVGYFRTARQHATELIEDFPDESEVLVQLARAEIGLEENEEAIRHLNNAITKDDVSPQAYRLLSGVLYEQNQINEAFQILQNSVERFSGDESIENQTESWLNRGLFRAVLAFQNSDRLNDPQLRSLIGQQAWYLEDGQEADPEAPAPTVAEISKRLGTLALEDAKRAREASTENLDQFLRAIQIEYNCHVAMRRSEPQQFDPDALQDVIASLEEQIQKHSDSYQLTAIRADLANLGNDQEGFVDWMRETVNRIPKESFQKEYYRYLLAEQELKNYGVNNVTRSSQDTEAKREATKRVDEQITAIEEFQNSPSFEEMRYRDPNVPQEFSQYGFAGLIAVLEARKDLWLDHDYQSAAQKFEPLLFLHEAFPDLASADVINELIYCYERLGNWKKAQSTIETALLRDPGNLDLRQQYVRILQQGGKTQQAKNETRRIILQQPNSFVANQVYLAHLINDNLQLPPSRRNWNEAVRIVSMLERNYPDNLDVTMLKVKLQGAMGDFVDAYSEINAAIEEHPDSKLLVSTRVLLLLQSSEPDRIEQAEKAIEEAVEQFGDQPSWRILKAQLAISKLAEANAPSEDASNGDDQKADVLAVLEEIHTLASAPESYSVDDRELLERGLVKQLDSFRRLYPQYDAIEKQLLESAIDVADLRTDRNSYLQEQLELDVFQYAVDAGSPETLQSRLKLLKDRASQGQENLGPLLEYGEALHLGLLAFQESQKSGNPIAEDSRLEEAIQHLDKALSLRPEWRLAESMVARMEVLSGHPGVAITIYQTIRDRNEADAEVLYTLAQLLQQAGRINEADAALKEALDLYGSTRNTNALQFATELSILTKNYDRAGNLAQSARTFSDQQDDAAWLAKVFMELAREELESGQAGSNSLNIAREHLDTALQMSPEDQSLRQLDVLYHHLKGDEEGVEKAIASAADSVDPEERELMLARCYLIVGEQEKSEDYLRQSIENCDDPEKLVVRIQMLAQLLLGMMQYDEAIVAYGQLIELASTEDVPPAVLIQARQTAAGLEAQHHGNPGFLRATRMLEENVPLFEGDDPVLKAAELQNWRVLAYVYTMRGDRASQEAAIGYFSRILDSGNELKPEDKMTLARLYASRNDKSKGDLLNAIALVRGLTELGGTDEQRAFYYVTLIDLLSAYAVQQGSGPEQDQAFDEAQRSLVILQSMQEDSTIWHSRRAKLHFARKDFDGLLEHLTFVARSRRANPSDAESQARIRWAAEISEYYGKQLATATDEPSQEASKELLKTAEGFYQDLVQLNPAAAVDLAGFLARDGRISSALDLVEGAREQIAIDRLIDFTSFAMAAHPVGNDHDRLMELVIYAEQNASGLEVIRILQVEAGLYVVQGEYDRAATSYEKILDIDGDNEVALNNLAMIEAVHRKNIQLANKLIDHALSVAGEKANLIDTKGIVQLAGGKNQEAAASFQKAVQLGSTPIRRIHLAYAYLQIKQLDNARNEYIQAYRDGLDPRTADAWDRVYLKSLRTAFGDFEQISAQTAMTTE